MKKVVKLGLVVATFAVVLASCKSSSGGNCDAYGKENTEVQSEVTPA